MGGERFGLGVAARRRGGVIVIVCEICRIPDPRSVLFFDWLALFIVFFNGSRFHVTKTEWIVG